MPPVGMKQAVYAALPGTMETIVKKTGLAESTVRRWLRAMCRGNPKIVRIKSWRRNNGLPTPYYVAGHEKDATFPKKKTQAQYSQKWRDARKVERLEMKAIRAEARAHADRAARTPQSWKSALVAMRMEAGAA